MRYLAMLLAALAFTACAPATSAEPEPRRSDAEIQRDLRELMLGPLDEPTPNCTRRNAS